MVQIELNEHVRLHGMWRRGEPGGVKMDLRGANLCDADLRGAYLRGAILPSDYRIATLCFGGWAVTVTPEETTIGCQTHPNADWLRWEPEDVVWMHPEAAAWWRQHREAVCAVIRDVMGKEV